MTRTRERNAEVGRRKQAAGAAFESWVDVQHAAALAMGLLGHVEHNQARAHVISGRVVYTGRGCADYTLLLPGGVYGVVEAKSVHGAALLRSAVAAKQADHLLRVARAGGVALLLVEFRHVDRPSRKLAIPWTEVPWRVRRTVESVVEEDVTKWEIPVGKCYLEPHVRGRLVREVSQQRRFPRE